MIKMDVVNWEGKKVSEAPALAEMFSQPLDKPLLHRAVCWQLAQRRRGTHSAKTRGEVRGGGKKPFRQKGTGNARQGSIRSPLLRGGGVIHGPKPRSYGERPPRKIRKKALACALSYLFKEERLLIMESMQSESGKTKELALRLKGAGWKKALLVDAPLEEGFQRALRNIPGFQLIAPEGVNVYDILRFDRLALTARALRVLSEKRFGESAEGAANGGKKAPAQAEAKNEAQALPPRASREPSASVEPNRKHVKEKSRGKGVKPAVKPAASEAGSEAKNELKNEAANKTQSKAAVQLPDAEAPAKQPRAAAHETKGAAAPAKAENHRTHKPPASEAPDKPEGAPK